MANVFERPQITALAVFLSSDEAGGMTGQAINVSAGREMR